MANLQKHQHHKSSQHQQQHCRGSHLSESHNAPERSNIDHQHSNDTHEQADIRLHHNPHLHHHHTQCKKHHRSNKKSHPPTSNASSAGSSLCSSCSTSTSSSTSSDSKSSSTSTTASSSSNSSSSSSPSSSSFSSSSSSSSSWSSASSLENTKFASNYKKCVPSAQHSWSCSDISRQRGAFQEDEEDTMPLLNKDGNANKSASMKKFISLKKKDKHTTKPQESSHLSSIKSTQKKEKCQMEIFRRAKSMEVLPVQNKQSAGGEINGEEIERKKEEARKNIMKEKMKFSAFLNEITRQVISPSRLQTLGVTDAHKAISPCKSQDSEGKGPKRPKHSSRQSGSTNSMSSVAPSHIRKNSSANKKSGQPYHSDKTSNSIKHHRHHLHHHHHHQSKTTHRNPKHPQHSANSHITNKTRSSKSHLARSEHGHKAGKKHQPQYSIHLTNATAMDAKRNTQKSHATSPIPHDHYNQDHSNHGGDHHSSSAYPPKSHQSPDHTFLHTESHHSHLESHHHHQKTKRNVPHSETPHHHHFHSQAHNHHHGDDHTAPSHQHSLCAETDHHPQLESNHHHGNQRHSIPGNNVPHLKTQGYSHSPSPSHQHHHIDGDHQHPSSHRYSLSSKNYDNSHSESLHLSPSSSCHYSHNDGDHRISSPSVSQPHHCDDQRCSTTQCHSYSSLHYLPQEHKNPPPHYNTLPSKPHGLRSHLEPDYCDSYSGSHHSSLPDIQCQSFHAEPFHPHHHSTNKDAHQYHTCPLTSHYYNNSHDSSSELDHHLHHDSSSHQIQGQHHSSYPDIHHHHSHHPSDDHHHHSYPNVHIHSDGGPKSPTNQESGKQSKGPHAVRHQQCSSYLDHQFNDHCHSHSGDPKTSTLNQHNQNPGGHYTQHHLHNSSHSVGHHQYLHPNSCSSSHSESYHCPDHLQYPHYHSEPKLQPNKESDLQHPLKSPESHKDLHHHSDQIHHHSHRHQEFHNHSRLEFPYPHMHTEPQHHPEHSKTHQYSNSKFRKASPHDCHKMLSHMESHYHHSNPKHPEPHHNSHPKSLHHSSHSELHLQYGGPKSFHHHDHEESYHHSHCKSYHHSQVKTQHHSDVKSLLKYHCPDSHHHHYGDDPNPLRHSPVGEKATSPCSSKSDSSRNTGSPINHDDQSVAYKETALTVKEKGSEYERIMMLQEQNEDLHNTLRQTVARMECLGAEFITEHHQLESELQRTRVELSSMMDKFTRLQANYSAIHQSDDFQEDERHCMDEHMAADREKLNQRILELTKQLSAAKTTIQSLETINVSSMLQEALVKHFKSDDPIKPFKTALAPPPFQFMDSDHYNKVSVDEDEQSLGPVAEEDESDWSEMGGEAKQYASSSLKRGHYGCSGLSSWQQEQCCWVKSDQYRRGDGDTESESGGEEMILCQGLQIPHLQFSVHPDTLPAPVAGMKQNLAGPVHEDYNNYIGRQLGSPIRILSGSLEGINSTNLQWIDHHGQIKCTKGMMDFHHRQQGTGEDCTEDEHSHTWKKTNEQHTKDGEKEAGSSGSESMANLESAQKMLNHFIQDRDKTKL